MLYVLVDGTIYKVNLKTGEKEAVVESLAEGQYVAGDDGHLIAYQDNGGLNDSTEVTILNFMTGETQKVTAAEGGKYTTSWIYLRRLCVWNLKSVRCRENSVRF